MAGLPACRILTPSHQFEEPTVAIVKTFFLQLTAAGTAPELNRIPLTIIINKNSKKGVAFLNSIKIKNRNY